MGIKEIINANSFAVIGASREENKVGNVIFKNLISNNIRAFPVNPSADIVLGYKSYKKISDIPEKIECAIIAIPARGVVSVLKDIVKSKIKNVILISSGFSEIKNDKLTNEVKNICMKNKINLLGPNTFGFINPNKKVNASFSDIMPENGNIAFLSQSGAIGAAIFDKKVKLSGFVSVGNSLLSDFSDFIDFYSNDNETKVIAIYMESLKEGCGKRFIDSCKKCLKPIVVLKAGKTDLGGKAAMSHTASLASPEGVYEGIFKQCGIIEANSVKELFDISETLVKIKNPKNKVCIITNAGGPGVLCTDYLLKNNMEIPEIPESVKKKLNGVLPFSWSHNNPVDVLGDSKAERYESCVKILNEEKFFDFFVIILTPQQMTEPEKTGDLILKLDLKKPVIFCFIGGLKVYWAIKKIKEFTPVFDELKDMAEVLGKIIEKE
ncbi:hypothetical protein GOV12_02795 [Candidatus Pacearchaeota archaeon]|nr:hypothetical protein [Candidatus Pacearchaeota archaeon]